MSKGNWNKFYRLCSKKIGTFSLTIDRKSTPYFSNIKEGEVILLITNSAVNKNGDILDVVVKVDNINLWADNSSVRFRVAYSCFLNSQLSPVSAGADYCNNPEYGDVLSFVLGATYADCDFTISYYLSGTVDETTGIGIDGQIENVASFYYDVDVPGNSTYASEFLNSNEGMKPLNGNTTIYYNKSVNANPEQENFAAQLIEIDDGIAAYKLSINTNGIWYANSTFFTTSNLNSTYKFKYGGVGCDITYSFMSIYPYSKDEPTKNVFLANNEDDKNKSTYILEDELIYKISQYIPNNYYGSKINFSEVYNNLYGESKYDEFIISDNVNENLEILKIYVTNETGEDVTSLFNIINNNNVSEKNTEEALNTSTFYNHTYTLNIKVKIIGCGNDSNLIGNTAKTTFKADYIKEDSEYTSTNDIEFSVDLKLIVNYISYTNRSLLSTTSTNYKLNDKYTTNYLKFNNYNLKADLFPTNQNGIFSECKNITVNYYYDKVDASNKIEETIKVENTGVNQNILVYFIGSNIFIIGAIIIYKN